MALDRIVIERLEARIAPAAITVETQMSDPDPNDPSNLAGKDHKYSLKEAIDQINHDHGGSITFALQNVTASEELPSINYKVTINGTAGGGGGPGTVIHGSGISGLDLAKGGTVTNLVINGFDGDGIDFEGPGMISNCYVGTDMAGSAAVPNTGEGIGVGGPGLTIMNCIVSGNGGDGIGIDGGNVTGVKVQGNKIGVDVTGLSALANGDFGVFIGSGAHKNLVGGLAASQRNIISGNAQDGVGMQISSGNTVEGNYIGVGIDGSTKLGNGGNGVSVDGGAGNIIGGKSAAARNIIAGNKIGVMVDSFVGGQFAGSTGTGTVVAANYLGLDANGTIFANTDAGVALKDGAANTTVGGTTAAARNIIAGSTDGVLIDNSSGTKVIGNFIGTGPNGDEDGFGNGTGVHLSGGASDNTIGGAAATARNIVSGNTGDGVSIEMSDSNTVAGNYIGTDVTAALVLANDGNGVSIDGDQNVVSKNVISGNTMGGVSVDGGSGNKVQSNFIGTDPTGTTAMGNSGDGVTLGGSQNTALQNVISGNDGNGVNVENGTSNTVQANHIGTDITGALALPNTGNGVTVNGGQNTILSNYISGNMQDGVAVEAGTSNLIQSNSIGVTAKGASALQNHMAGITIKGAQTTVLKNVVSGNHDDGISIEAGDSDTILGNYVGTDSKGKGVVPNGGDGIHTDTSNLDIIGGKLAGQRNVVGGNVGDGIHIENGGGETIKGNSVGTDSTGKLGLGNGGDGIHLETSDGNTIGGAMKGEGNFVNWNTGDGIHLETGNDNLIKGNVIGTDAAAKKNEANQGEGIHLTDSKRNTIGGTAKGEGNTIAFNKHNGIVLDGGDHNFIEGNSIVFNGDLGISLINNANAGQAVPVIATAGKVNGKFTITGSVAGAVSTSITLDLYSNKVPDPSGAGEGQTFLGEVTVMTDGAGLFSAVFATAPAAGTAISLTVRVADGTSEFSQDVAI